MKECKIRIYGCTTQCHECGQYWRKDDKNPPKCPQNKLVGLNFGQKIEKLACFLFSCVKLVAVLAVIYFAVSTFLLLGL